MTAAKQGTGKNEFRILGRREGNDESIRFTYRGVDFHQDCFHVVAGLNAVDTREYAERTFRALKEAGQVCARMGAYKPRTSPYSFQGYGKQCLPYVFELAGKYGVRVISMEVTRDEHLDEIRAALAETGDPCGVMLQIGTRNTQNFELLKTVGSQRDFPILLKRGFGITLHESLLAAEYVAAAGNRDIAFCLRGMKTHFGDPHRNLVDFAHVPVVKRLTRMPVCIDPSHSVGRKEPAPDGITDIQHVTAQGVIAGANMVLVDFHPHPAKALVDGPQALRLEELPWFLDDVAIARGSLRAPPRPRRRIRRRSQQRVRHRFD
jgi:3-deoxy-7-phosphoheptulonate synthase